MRLGVSGIEVEVDDRHARNPAMWVLRYVFGPTTSPGPGNDLGDGEESPRRSRDSLPPNAADADKQAAAAALEGAM